VYSPKVVITFLKYLTGRGLSVTGVPSERVISSVVYTVVANLILLLG